MNRTFSQRAVNLITCNRISKHINISGYISSGPNKNKSIKASNIKNSEPTQTCAHKCQLKF